MTTITEYNHTRKLFANAQVVLADLRVMLVNAHTFDPTDTNISSIVADEVSGGGWDTGGEALAGAAITVTTVDEATLDATDLSVAATAADIGPATGAVIYQDTTSNEFPLFYIDFEGSVTAQDGVDNFEIVWNALGIARWRNP